MAMIKQATSMDMTSSPMDRSRLSYRHATAHVTVEEQGEQLVFRDEIEADGIVCEPFWETPGDTEGECYLPYIKTHPEFTVAMRKSVFERLVVAKDQLPDDWQLVVKAAYRPLEVQQSVLEAFMSQSQHDHPEWSHAQHLAHARTFVADPAIVCPPHTTGGAVDVDVRSKTTGAMIDMGCPPNTDSDVSFLHSDLMTGDQHRHRMILLAAMLDAGFAPNAYEWWHYQYGETYWAAFYGHNQTIYDVIKVY